MLLRWLTNWKRRAHLAQPFPEPWHEVLAQNVRTYGFLSPDEQARVRTSMQVFVAEKNWEGCGGLAMTQEIKATIAGHVGVLTLGLGEQYFDRVQSILVYPTTYLAPRQVVVGKGLVLEGGDSTLAGEAWHRGPVIFSWTSVLEGGRGERPGNVVFHEFAHQLDMLNGGDADGYPPVEDDELGRRWPVVMEQHFEELKHACERGLPRVLDCYGTKNPAEFFAVATETFFTEGRRLRSAHEPLYDCLRGYYGQDPAAWKA